jgi:CheY-specific phosphatase CheX
MCASNFIEPSTVLPENEWHSVLIETALEVFSTMVGVNVTVPEEALRAPAQVTAIVGIAGAMRATLVLQCAAAPADKLAAHMLGAAPADSRAACDALGEICNIVAGYFKAKIGLGDACMLSVPTVVMGKDYRFHSPQASVLLELPLAYEGDVIWATLKIAK